MNATIIFPLIFAAAILFLLFLIYLAIQEQQRATKHLVRHLKRSYQPALNSLAQESKVVFLRDRLPGTMSHDQQPIDDQPPDSTTHKKPVRRRIWCYEEFLSDRPSDRFR